MAQRRARGQVGSDDRTHRPNAQDARSRDLVQYDLGLATMSIMVAAADLGIGSAHSAVSDQALARRLLGFPEDRFCAWLITPGVMRVATDARRAGEPISSDLWYWRGRVASDPARADR